MRMTAWCADKAVTPPLLDADQTSRAFHGQKRGSHSVVEFGHWGPDDRRASGRSAAGPAPLVASGSVWRRHSLQDGK